MWCSEQEYNESGPGIIHRSVYFLSYHYLPISMAHSILPQSASKHGQRSSEKELYFHCTRMTLLLIFYDLGMHSHMLSLDDTIYFYSFHYFYNTFSWVDIASRGTVNKHVRQLNLLCRITHYVMGTHGAWPWGLRPHSSQSRKSSCMHALRVLVCSFWATPVEATLRVESPNYGVITAVLQYCLRLFSMFL